MHNLIIVGAGPAGMAAAITAHEYKIKTLVVASEIVAHEDGESPLFSVADLKDHFEKLCTHSEFIEYKKSNIVHIEKNIVSLSLESSGGQIFYGATVLIATGQENQEGRSSLETITEKDTKGCIKVSTTMSTSVSGLFAAGDITAESVPDSLVAAGQGVRAVLAIKDFLKTRK